MWRGSPTIFGYYRCFGLASEGIKLAGQNSYREAQADQDAFCFGTAWKIVGCVNQFDLLHFIYTDQGISQILCLDVAHTHT